MYDTVTLQPVLTASGLSACPGQDVTLNCTIVRKTTLSEGVLPAPLTWQYRGDTIKYNSPSQNSSVYYTAVFHVVGGLTVISNATINNVLLSHNGSMMNCVSPVTTLSEIIAIAGKYKL